MLIESWRRHYNAVRPHSSLGYRPPAPLRRPPSSAARPSMHKHSNRTYRRGQVRLTYSDKIDEPTQLKL